ncbi:MAG: autotransporter-associated beta strand repeat-containing protein, partial [Clostridia bacterium]|nr:autotransporter-associated beta strand repeat-containing protein [Clostridia bacterium]
LTLNITGKDLTYQGKIDGNIELIVNADGEGKQTLNNNASTFTGNIVINGGTLVASASWKYVDTTVFGDYVSKTVTVNDGAELVFAAQDVVSNAGTNSPIRFIANGGTIRNSGTVYNNLSNTEFTDGAQLYAADGNATWKAYKLSSKVSVLRNTDGSAAQPVTFSSDLSKANATYSFGDGTSFYVEDITSSSAAAADANADLIISALVTNPNEESNGTFHKDGAGILEFTAANTFDGTASIREGVLRLSGNGALGTSTVTLGDKGTLELNVSDGAEKSFTNKVTGTGTVAKTGAGTLKLNTANGFESALNISEGRADVFGTMAGKISVADGAVFSPGGTLTLGGALSADAGSRLVFELGGDTSDLLVLSGDAAFDISEDAAIEFLFTGDTPGSSYTLIEANDDLSDLLNAEFWSALMSEETAENWHLAVVGNTLQLLAGAGTGDTSLPEPATWVLLVLGAAGLYCVRRRNAK